MANTHPNFVPFDKAGPGRAKGSRNRLTMQRVETELRHIATLDPLGIFERSSGNGPNSRYAIRDLARMRPEVRACIARMRVRLERGPLLPDGSRGPSEEVLEIWFWDKVKALELCAKHFGWVSTKATVLVGKELRELLEEGRRRNAEFRANTIDVTPRSTDGLGHPFPAPQQLEPAPLLDVTPTGAPTVVPEMATRVPILSPTTVELLEQTSDADESGDVVI